jgi:putative glycosyltransferase (TIGR04372 family)
MLFKIKLFVIKFYVAYFGGLTVWILTILAKSQLSGNALVRGIGFPPFKFADLVLGFGALRFIAHVNRREPRRSRRPHIKSTRLRSYLYLAIGSTDKKLVSQLKPKNFRIALLSEDFDHETQYVLAHQLFQAGNLSFACECFEDLIERLSDKFSLDRRLQLYRDAGVSFFMHGKIERANHYWRKAGELRRFILGEESGPIYRILGSSWFAAIGHVAMLDFYAKYNKLYRGNEVRVVAQVDISKVPGSYLCERLSEKDINFIELENLHDDYDEWAVRHGKRRWNQLTLAEQFAMVDDFWEFEFPDGEIWGYTHAANKIQKEWESQKRSPLLSVTDGEQKFIRRALSLLGLPEGVWYVCLHVREPGFHKGWNTLYPSMRDANIDDYLPAIDLIVKNGGWVIRMGDPSMKPLEPIPGVIDYAHSTLKTPRADILIPLNCRFFLGTNSGYATIPAIYGIRCIFSNWLPIGLPLWPSQDLMLPKLFWDERYMRFLTFEEIFSSGLAFIQNWADLPKGITLHDNTPEELVALVEEALGISFNLVEQEVHNGLNFVYQQISNQNNSYCGAQLADSFVHKHHGLLQPTSKGK